MPLFNPGVDAVSVSNTLFSSGSFRLTGGPGVTVGSDASGGSVSGQAFSLAASNSTFTSGSFRITGGPGVTVGSDASGASVSGQAFSLAASNSTFTSGSFRITGGPGVTVGSDASGASIKAGINLPAWRNFEGQDANVITALSVISRTPFYFGEQIEGQLTLASFGLRVSQIFTGTQLSGGSRQSMDVHLGVYTRVNSTSMALLGSASNNFDLSTASSASWSGIRNLILTSPGTVAAISTLSGGDYIFGMMVSATAAVAMNFQLFGAGLSAGNTVSAPIGVIHPGNAYSTGTSQGFMGLFGRQSVSLAALPANVVASDLVNQSSGAAVPLRPWIYIRS